MAIQQDKRAIKAARDRMHQSAAELSALEDELRRHGIQFVVHQ